MLTVNAAWNVWNFRRPVISALIADGHRVSVLAPSDEFAPALERLGCRFIPLRMDLKGLNPARDMVLVWRFRRLFAKHRPDAILGFTIKNNLYGAVASRSLGIPFIPNVTGLGTAFLSGGPLQSLAKSFYRAAFASLPVVFFQNEDDRGLFVDNRLVAQEQARVLPGSGIDLDHFAAAPYPDKGRPPVFLMIARLLRDKGVHEFVKAAGIVRQRHPEARFQLLGAADAANRTAIDLETVRGWHAKHTIEYLGTSDDVREQIAAANCVVLPSYREGAPRTLIEAAAMARPIVATDVPGCRAVVDEAKSGFLCEVRDAKSLADACVRFLELDRQEQAAMGQAGRKKMEREFDQAIVADAYRAVLRDLIPVAERTIG